MSEVKKVLKELKKYLKFLATMVCIRDYEMDEPIPRFIKAIEAVEKKL